jgi:hypothetical protein
MIRCTSDVAGFSLGSSRGLLELRFASTSVRGWSASMSAVLAANVDSKVLESWGGAGAPSSIIITSPGLSGSFVKASEAYRQGARQGALVPRCTASLD